MVDAGPRLEAELAYQRALAALHEARAELAEVSAAQRRLTYDRMRLEAATARAREQELDARYGEVAARAEQLRQVAATRREQLRRYSVDASAEPVEVPDDERIEGFEQPPFFGTGE